jgi:uncharacterized membrane protein YjjP (DUF1212 family)
VTGAPTLSFADLRDVLELSLRAGQLMLENGANTSRVEETIERLGGALGADRVDVYVTPTGIIASAFSGGEHRTKLLRIYRSGIDLNRTASVLALADLAEARKLDREGVRRELGHIAAQRRLYGHWLTAGAVALACAAFGVLVGGGVLEACATAAAAGPAQLLRAFLGRRKVGRVTVTYVVAVLGSWAGLELARAIGAPSPEVALLSPVLLLVPGVLMVSSIADLFRGDTISGMARSVQAVLIIVTIGAGLWTTTLLSQTHVTSTAYGTLPLGISAPLSFIAALGFAILFDVPKRALPLAALVGAAAFVARAGALQLASPPELAIFVGGATAALLAEPAARWTRLSMSIFIIPAFIPLVPGVAAFQTVLELANENYALGTAGLVRTAILVGALAAGVGVVNALRPTRRNA